MIAMLCFDVFPILPFWEENIKLTTLTRGLLIGTALCSSGDTGRSYLFLPALAFPLCGNSFPAPGSCPPFQLVTPGNGSIDSGEPTWHAGLNYRPNADTLIYAKYDRGYKSGGFIS